MQTHRLVDITSFLQRAVSPKVYTGCLMEKSITLRSFRGMFSENKLATKG